MFLAYGYYDVIAGEESSTIWMPHEKFNWNRIASHKHDGIDSALLTSMSFAKITQILLSTDWVVSGSGYKQPVSMPVGWLYANTFMRFFINKLGDPFDGAEFYPTAVPTGTNTYDLYCNDNTIGVICIYV